MTDKPKVVCIIGSSRFKNDHLGVAQRETLKGKIVLITGFFHHVDRVPISSVMKRKLDDLQLRKVEMSDEVIVVNINGYVGESTMEQIEHASRLGKPISWLEDKGHA